MGSLKWQGWICKVCNSSLVLSFANSTGCCKGHRVMISPHLHPWAASQFFLNLRYMTACDHLFCEVLTMIAAATYLYSNVVYWHYSLFHGSMETLKCRQFSFFITTIPIVSCKYILSTAITAVPSDRVYICTDITHTRAALESTWNTIALRCYSAHPQALSVCNLYTCMHSVQYSITDT